MRTAIDPQCHPVSCRRACAGPQMWGPLRSGAAWGLLLFRGFCPLTWHLHCVYGNHICALGVCTASRAPALCHGPCRGHGLTARPLRSACWVLRPVRSVCWALYLARFPGYRSVLDMRCIVHCTHIAYMETTTCCVLAMRAHVVKASTCTSELWQRNINRIASQHPALEH